MSVHSSLKTSTAVAILVPVLALGVPVIDTLLVMARRYTRHPASFPAKRLARVFRADRNHVHHLLLFFGGSRTRIVLTLYAMVLASCVFSLAVALADSVALGIALVLVEALVLLAVRHSGVILRRNGATQAPNAPIPDRRLNKKVARPRSHPADW